MSHVGVWCCDGCGFEDRGGWPGMPPEGWSRVDATTYGHLHAQADYCPDCARKVDTYALALTANRPYKPEQKPRKKQQQAGLLEVDEKDGAA